MYFNLLSQINFVAVIVASIIFFLIGAFWYSAALFGPAWVAELRAHNVTIHKPAKNHLFTKMLLSFCLNFVTCLALALLVNLTGSATLHSGLSLGIVATVGFAFTTLGCAFAWENRSLKLFAITAGYYAMGIIAAACLLSVWQ